MQESSKYKREEEANRGEEEGEGKRTEEDLRIICYPFHQRVESYEPQ